MSAGRDRARPPLARPAPMVIRVATILAILAGVSFCAAVRPAAAQPSSSLPTLTAPVNDFAHVIDAASAAELDRRIRVLQTTTGDAVVVLTVQTFAPYGSIEEFAVREFEQAKIGQAGKDNGVLIVMAAAEHRVRIEVGYGLEEFITDGFAGDTIRQAMLPAFRQGQYGAGLLAGTTRVIDRIAQARNVTLPNVPVAPQSQNNDDGGSIVGFVIIMIVLFAILSRIGRRRGGFLGPGIWWGGPWSGWGGGGFGGGGFGGGGFGGGGGGGFGGFGGGRSGGGGASGGW